MKKKLFLILILCLLFGSQTVFAGRSADKAAVLPRSIIITDASGSDITGQQITLDRTSVSLKAVIEPPDLPQDVSWTSSDTTIAGVSDDGLFSFKKSGTVVITAVPVGYVDISASVTLFLRPAASSIMIKNAKGQNITNKTVTVKTAGNQLRAAASPSNALQKFSWKSSNTNVAVVSADGKVTFKKAGSVLITVTCLDRGKVSAKVRLKLLPKAKKIIIRNASGKAITGKTVRVQKPVYQLKAAALPKNAEQTVTWKSSNTKIATVDANGKVTFKKAGIVRIRAISTDRGKKSAWVKLRLLPASKKIVILNENGENITGRKRTVRTSVCQLMAMVKPAKASQKVKWVSSDLSIAAVNKYGLVVFKQPGTVTITVKAVDRGKAVGKVKLTGKFDIFGLHPMDADQQP